MLYRITLHNIISYHVVSVISYHIISYYAGGSCGLAGCRWARAGAAGDLRGRFQVFEGWQGGFALGRVMSQAGVVEGFRRLLA